MLSTFVGNEQVKQNITNALNNNRLPNSIMITAPKGGGSNYFAVLIAANYLFPNNQNAQARVLQKNASEVLYIEGSGASGQISVEEIRNLRSKIYETSLETDGRVVIIKNAENLNQSSANALLKVLEEPPKGVFFILTAKDQASVIQTILSRCAIYSLTVPSVMQCAEFLVNSGYDKQKVDVYANALSGNIGRCVKILTDEKQKKAFEISQQILKAIKAKDKYQLLCLTASLEKDKSLAVNVLDLLYQISSAIINTGVSENFENIDIKTASLIGKVSQGVISTINKNTNLKLCLAGFCARF